MGGCADDLESAALWHSYGNKIVVIKHGKLGSMAYADDGSKYQVGTFPVQKLKGFGGGDGYASAFLFSLLKGKSLKDALEFATASASMLISAHSCSAAMPSEKAIEDFIAQQRAQGCAEVVSEI